MRSELMRMKVLRYYEETLLSRLNNPNVPIINIQQRLHLEDISGLLKEKYNFYTVKRPLIDENGKCLIPTQYTEERIKELQINNYMFSAQYQQEPIVLGGDVIKREWFRYYDVNTKFNYQKIVIAGDTAMTVKEHSDYTCWKNTELHEDFKHLSLYREGDVIWYDLDMSTADDYAVEGVE